VNYLPTKFSSSLLGGGTARKRKGKKGEDDVLDPVMPKRGGGVEAFKSGEARMPGEGDVDYDGVTDGWFGAKTGGSTSKKLRWNKFKWILFCANVLVRSFDSLFSLSINLISSVEVKHLLHWCTYRLPAHLV
jgi:hypothetical protein